MARRASLLAVLAVGGTVLLTPGVAAGGGCVPEKGLEMTSSSKTTIAIDNCAFVDTVTYVEPGAKVRWVSGDHVPHTVTGAALSWGAKDVLEMGDAVSYSFEKEGVYPYYCDFHPTMVGAVVVGDGGGPTAAAGAGVTAIDDAAPTSSKETAPVETGDGASPIVVALAIAAALAAAAGLARYALGRRTSAPSVT